MTMSHAQLYVQYGFDRYKDMVWAAERRAMRHPGIGLQLAANEGFYRKAANWLGTRLMNWGRSLRHLGTAPAHGEQPAR
jgi:hypothetical protein